MAVNYDIQNVRIKDLGVYHSIYLDKNITWQSKVEAELFATNITQEIEYDKYGGTFNISYQHSPNVNFQFIKGSGLEDVDVEWFGNYIRLRIDKSGEELGGGSVNPLNLGLLTIRATLNGEVYDRDYNIYVNPTAGLNFTKKTSSSTSKGFMSSIQYRKNNDPWTNFGSEITDVKNYHYYDFRFYVDYQWGNLNAKIEIKDPVTQIVDDYHWESVNSDRWVYLHNARIGTTSKDVWFKLY